MLVMGPAQYLANYNISDIVWVLFRQLKVDLQIQLSIVAKQKVFFIWKQLHDLRQHLCLMNLPLLQCPGPEYVANFSHLPKK